MSLRPPRSTRTYTLLPYPTLFRSRDGSRPNEELYSTDNRSTADGLAGLPRDYSGVPRLGPPLPGDLGRPIVGAQERGQPVPAPGIGTPNPGISPEEQRRQIGRAHV